MEPVYHFFFLESRLAGFPQNGYHKAGKVKSMIGNTKIMVLQALAQRAPRRSGTQNAIESCMMANSIRDARSVAQSHKNALLERPRSSYSGDSDGEALLMDCVVEALEWETLTAQEASDVVQEISGAEDFATLFAYMISGDTNE